jgi:hypothetical protein
MLTPEVVRGPRVRLMFQEEVNSAASARQVGVDQIACFVPAERASAAPKNHTINPRRARNVMQVEIAAGARPWELKTFV